MSKIFAIIMTVLVALFIISSIVLPISDSTGVQTKAIVLTLLMILIGLWAIISIIKSF